MPSSPRRRRTDRDVRTGGSALLRPLTRTVEGRSLGRMSAVLLGARTLRPGARCATLARCDVNGSAHSSPFTGRSNGNSGGRNPRASIHRKRKVPLPMTESTTGPPYKVGAIANFMLDRARTDLVRLTHLKLQKLVYIAYGWATVFLDDELFEEPIEAWQFGPVVPHLWHEFKAYQDKPIKGRSFDYDPNTNSVIRLSIPKSDKETRRVLEMTWKNYGHATASHLVTRTHAEGTPWDRTELHDTIDRDLITEHFAELYATLRARQQTG